MARPGMAPISYSCCWFSLLGLYRTALKGGCSFCVQVVYCLSTPVGYLEHAAIQASFDRQIWEESGASMVYDSISDHAAIDVVSKWRA